MGKKGKKAQAGKPKKLTPKDIGKRLDALARKLEEDLKGADLFAPMPPTEDCAICLLPLPRRVDKSLYRSCCGNTICMACGDESFAAIKKQNEKNAGKKDKPVIRYKCPFCRAPFPTSFGEVMCGLEARKLYNNHRALDFLASIYGAGAREYGQAEDKMKALDYCIQATELGSPDSPENISVFYREGILQISKDMERAALFSKVAAIRGSVKGRQNADASEYYVFGNHELAIRHWKIAAEGGSQVSLNSLRSIYNADGKLPGKEFISKEDLDSLYRACHEAQEEVSSEERKKHWGSKDDVFKC